MIFTTVDQLRDYLHTIGCKNCELGFQKGLNGCCVSRGEWQTRRMIIGEAPGKIENSLSSPFTGPAGQLMDKIFASVGWDTNTDWYMTNTILCRPIAERGSGKENLTPKAEQKRRCRPYLETQISLIQPSIIVTLGKVSTDAILGKQAPKSMGDCRGKIFNWIFQDRNIIVFPMLHPAALLHAQRQPEKYQLYREQTWQDIKNLKKIIDQKEI